jgi:hypothetical protein
MTDKTPQQLVANLRERFRDRTDVEMQALIVTIWLIGATKQLACLGIIGGGQIKEIDGLDQWDDIDKYRYRLIPPNLLSSCLISFAEVAATEEVRIGAIKLLAAYYNDTGRQILTAESLNRIFMNSPAN